MEALDILRELPSRVKVVPPVGYLDMLELESQARVILTDSGGVQREAYFLSVPSVILRGETEWPELVESGASRLAGEWFGALTSNGFDDLRVSNPTEAFGAGDASLRISRCLTEASA